MTLVNLNISQAGPSDKRPKLYMNRYVNMKYQRGSVLVLVLVLLYQCACSHCLSALCVFYSVRLQVTQYFSVLSRTRHTKGRDIFGVIQGTTFFI